MDANDIAMVDALIKDALKPILEQIEKVEDNLLNLEMKLDDKASDEHCHEDYASADHVERSEHSLGSQISRLSDNISNLEYRVSEAERKAEQAQSTANSAFRSGSRGYY